MSLPLIPNRISACGALIALFAFTQLPGAAKDHHLVPMRGIVAEAPGNELPDWGVGQDKFEDIFDSISVRASSTHAPEGRVRYDARNIHDNDFASAWVEGAPGDGIGEYIEFELKPSPPAEADRAIRSLTIFNGYRKSRRLWKENGRVRELLMSVDDRQYGVITLADDYRFQTVDVGKIPLPKRGPLVIRFMILSVYPGTTYHDTALSELHFDGTGIY